MRRFAVSLGAALVARRALAEVMRPLPVGEQRLATQL